MILFFAQGIFLCFYYLIIITSKPEVASVTVLTFPLIFIVATMYIHNSFRLHYILELNAFIFVLIVAIFSFYITVLVIDTCKLFNWYHFLDHMIVYLFYLCIYFWFVFSIIEILTKTKTIRLLPFAQPVFAFYPKPDTQIIENAEPLNSQQTLENEPEYAEPYETHDE